MGKKENTRRPRFKGPLKFRGLVVDVQGNFHYEDFNTEQAAMAYIKGSFNKVIKMGWLNGRQVRGGN